MHYLTKGRSLWVSTCRLMRRGFSRRQPEVTMTTALEGVQSRGELKRNQPGLEEFEWIAQRNSEGKGCFK